MRDPTCKNWDETRSHFQRESPTTQQSLFVVSKETFVTGKSDFYAVRIISEFSNPGLLDFHAARIISRVFQSWVRSQIFTRSALFLGLSNPGLAAP